MAKKIQVNAVFINDTDPAADFLPVEVHATVSLDEPESKLVFERNDTRRATISRKDYAAFIAMLRRSAKDDFPDEEVAHPVPRADR